MPEPSHDRPMQGIFMISTDSTAQGFTFDNNLPVVIAYSGFKTVSGEFVYAETFNNYPIIAVESKYDLIAEGKYSTRYKSWSKIGYNPDVGSAEETINFAGSAFWAASSGQPMRVVSANNNDKPASTSGCLSVWVKYLGPDYLEYSTVVTLNGTTAVTLVDTSITRIQNFQAYTGIAPAGNVTLGPSTGGAISTIQAGFTRARNSMWTVPSNKTLYIKNIYYSAAGEGGAGRPTRFLLRTNYNPEQERYSTSLFWPISANLLEDTPIFASLDVPLRVPARTDLYVTTITVAASSGNFVESILRGWTVENT